MPAQLPGALDRSAPAEALDLVGMHAAQQARRQGKAAQQLELGDLGQQALQPDPARIGREPGEGGALAVVGQQSVKALAQAGIETVGHALQRRIVVGGAGRAQDAVEPAGAGPADTLAREPAADLLLHRRRHRLARQQLVSQPAAEPGLGRVVEGSDREVVEDEAAVPASGASRPVVAVERVRLDADLGGQMPDHCWRQFGLLVGKAPVLAPVGELRSKPELAGVGQVSQQLQLFRPKRPTLAEFICRPQPLHRPAPSRPGRTSYGTGTAGVSLLGQNAQLRGHWARLRIMAPPVEAA